MVSLHFLINYLQFYSSSFAEIAKINTHNYYAIIRCEIFQGNYISTMQKRARLSAFNIIPHVINGRVYFLYSCEVECNKLLNQFDYLIKRLIEIKKSDKCS